jgi:hypothetical protein
MPAVHKAACFVVAAALGLAFLAMPADAQSPEASQAQDLSNCAGAVAALANLDVMSRQRSGGGAWAIVLDEILAALNREPGVEGMTGRYAASAARAYWAERPRAEQEEAATRCRTRYGSQ